MKKKDELNGSFGILWDLFKHEIDGVRADISRVENRLLEKFDDVDKKFSEWDKTALAGFQRLESVEGRIQRNEKRLDTRDKILIGIIIALIPIAVTIFVRTFFNIWV